MQKIFLITLFCSSLCYGFFPVHPVAKSFLMPGSGERDLGYHKSSKFFLQSEILLFTACYSAFKTSDLIEYKYISYAAKHAGATASIDERYWTDIGNYNTNNDFDFEHLRMRDSKEGQWSDHPWDWQSDDIKRKKFEDMRIKSDKYFLVGKFLVVEGAENLKTEGGYAKEAGKNFKKKQEELLAETLKKIDIVICTALIPGKQAPKIISEKMIDGMQTGQFACRQSSFH